MEYNKCEICGADGGRCGMMIKTEKCPKNVCLNCHKTWDTGELVIHAWLSRTDEEIKKTAKILEWKT